MVVIVPLALPTSMHSPTRFVVILGLMSFLGGPAGALDQEMNDALNAYNRGDISSCSAQCHKALEENSKNPEAWFLLGHCNVKQDKFADACYAYGRCLQSNPDDKLNASAVRALINLANRKNRSQIPTPSDDRSKAQGKGSAELRNEEREIQYGCEARIQSKEAEKKQRIQRLIAEADAEIAEIPMSGYEAQNNMAPNPDRLALVAAIHSRTQAKIDMITADYDKQERMIKEETQRRLDALSEPAESRSQLKQQPGRADQVSSAGTPKEREKDSSNLTSNEHEIQFEGDERIQAKEVEKKARIQRLISEADAQIAGIPTSSYDGQNNWVPNPDRPALVAAIHNKTQAIIDMITADYEKQELMIKRETQRRLDALADFSQSTKRSPSKAISSVRPTASQTKVNARRLLKPRSEHSEK